MVKNDASKGCVGDTKDEPKHPISRLGTIQCCWRMSMGVRFGGSLNGKLYLVVSSEHPRRQALGGLERGDVYTNCTVLSLGPANPQCVGCAEDKLWSLLAQPAESPRTPEFSLLEVGREIADLSWLAESTMGSLQQAKDPALVCSVFCNPANPRRQSCAHYRTRKFSRPNVAGIALISGTILSLPSLAAQSIGVERPVAGIEAFLVTAFNRSKMEGTRLQRARRSTGKALNLTQNPRKSSTSTPDQMNQGMAGYMVEGRKFLVQWGPNC